jgi:hypothetical protein
MVTLAKQVEHRRIEGMASMAMASGPSRGLTLPPSG